MHLGIVWCKLSATFAGQPIVILFSINKIEVEVDFTVCDVKMWLLAVLMGDHIKEGLLYENVWPFHQAEKKCP